MPIYEYECLGCGKIEEAIQKFSDKPLTKCPHCSGKLQKLISQSSFHLKGSGWYVTDYAAKSGKNKKSSKNTDAAPLKDSGTEPSKKESKAKTAASNEAGTTSSS